MWLATFHRVVKEGWSTFALGCLKMQKNVHDIEVYPDFKVWQKDRQLRPCIGTIENDRKRHDRSQLPSGGFMLRVGAIFDVLTKNKISLTAGAMTFHAKCQRSEAFHIKYAMFPDVYIKIFCPAVGITLPPTVDQKVYDERFRRDYYADNLRVIQDHCDKGSAVAIEPSNKLVHAPPDELLTTGPLVLCKMPPICYNKLNDKVINDFEEAVHSSFGRNTWYSVCLYVSEDVSLEKAKLCIGAKVDERKFIEVIKISDEMKTKFLENFKYKPPKRSYHADQTRHEAKKRKVGHS